MNQTTTYLIPTTTTRDGLPMEYRIIDRKRDMRTTFCKSHDKDIVDKLVMNNLINNYRMIVKNDRVIAPNGRIAYQFKRDLRRLKR